MTFNLHIHKNARVCMNYAEGLHFSAFHFDSKVRGKEAEERPLFGPNLPPYYPGIRSS